MKATAIFILCLIALTKCDMTLAEIDRTDFGHTLIDTISLELRALDVEDGALTGPVKVIYDMLIELRDSLKQADIDGDVGLETLCVQCTSTINEYKGKVEVLGIAMAEDTLELTTISALTAGLQQSETLATTYVTSLEGMLETLRLNHEASLLVVQGLKDDAQATYNALIKAKAVIKDNLQTIQPEIPQQMQFSPDMNFNPNIFIQTNAGTSARSNLASITSSFKGYANLASQFLDLSENEDIVSDQGLVDSLLRAFDDLIDVINDQVMLIQGQYDAKVLAYNSEKNTLDTELLNAKNDKLNKAQLVSTNTLRISALTTKSTQDTSDFIAWSNFVADETTRCAFEETTYETAQIDRTQQILILEEIITLFETKFVEMNEYINSRVDLNDEIVTLN